MHLKPSNAKPVVVLKEVTHTYQTGDGPVLTVLQGINLELHEDELVALVGPSGCGKSTLIRIITGLILPTEGIVEFRGKRLLEPNPEVAMVFQNFSLLPWLSVRENVRLPLLNRPGERDEFRVDEVIRQVGLNGFEDAYPREISGGMKQRVGIARALVVEPEMLCLDEPFSALDVLTAETLRSEIARLCTDPGSRLKTAAMVTHNISESVFLAKRIVVLAAHPGRIERIIENPLPYPRDPFSREFQSLVGEIHGVLTQSMNPDNVTQDLVSKPTESAEVRRVTPAPLPAVGITQILGILQILQGNVSTLVEVSEALHVEFTKTLQVVKAAELLGMVETPGDEIHLTVIGKQFQAARPAEQKVVLRRQMEKLKLFEFLLRMIDTHPNQQIQGEEILKEFEALFPHEKSKILFQTLVGWGRFAELISYDQRKHIVKRYEKKYLGRPTSSHNL